MTLPIVALPRAFALSLAAALLLNAREPPQREAPLPCARHITSYHRATDIHSQIKSARFVCLRPGELAARA